MKNSPSSSATPAPAATTSVPLRPEFFRLPGSRGGDAHFGFSRSWYYEQHRAGRIRLISVRQPGSVKGRVLVSYQEIADLIRKAATEPTPERRKKP